jgi:hypothetical protein
MVAVAQHAPEKPPNGARTNDDSFHRVLPRFFLKIAHLTHVLDILQPQVCFSLPQAAPQIIRFSSGIR